MAPWCISFYVYNVDKQKQLLKCLHKILASFDTFPTIAIFHPFIYILIRQRTFGIFPFYLVNNLHDLCFVSTYSLSEKNLLSMQYQMFHLQESMKLVFYDRLLLKQH